MLKVYVSLQANPLSVDLPLADGGFRSADFTGGLKRPIVIMPKLYTEDEELQKALESSVYFNKSFALVKGEPDVMNFATVKEAKEWLNKEKDVPYNKMTTKDLVTAMFLEQNIEVFFATDNN